MANQGIYTDTRWLHTLQFASASGLSFPLSGVYACNIYRKGNPTPVMTLTEASGMIDATNKSLGKFVFSVLPSQHQPSVPAGLYRLHFKRVDSVDNYWAAAGELLVGNPGDNETYMRFENQSDGSTLM